MLEEIDRDLWIADGPSVRFLGLFPYPTRMTLVRLADGGLWVCSPIALDDGLRREVDALGPVRHLVAPNKLHHLFLAPWARAYPQALLHAPPGLARRRRDLSFDHELGDAPHPAWAGQIDQVVFRGSFALEEVVFFHRPTRTVIVTDLVQKFPAESQHGWRGLVMRLDGLVGPEGGSPRDWRLSVWNRRAAREARDRILAWNCRRLLIAHGQWLPEGGQAALERAFRWLG